MKMLSVISTILDHAEEHHLTDILDNREFLLKLAKALGRKDSTALTAAWLASFVGSHPKWERAVWRAYEHSLANWNSPLSVNVSETVGTSGITLGGETGCRPNGPS